VPRLFHLLLLLALTLSAWGQAAAEQELVEADFVLADDSLPPGDQAAWTAQALPDTWHINHPAAQARGASNGWYRLRFVQEPPGEGLQALLLPKLGLNAAVFLNGRSIGDGGHFTEPLGRNWNRPLLFILPPDQLRPGQNTLHIRLLSHAYTQASLHPPRVGSEARLRDAYEQATFLRVTVNQTASLLILAVGLLMLTLWWRRRQDVAYGYFGLSALVWAAQSTNLYLRQAPLPTAPWEILINSSFQVFSALLLISLLRFSVAGGRPLVPLLWFSALASPITQWLAPPRHFLAVTAFWHVFTLILVLATLAFLLRAAIRWRNRDAALMAGAMGLVALLGAHDWLIHSQHFWPGAPRTFTDDLYLLHYSAPLIFLAVGFIMAGRYVRVLNEFETLNNELESRVRLKHSELLATYARMRAMETEQAIGEERARIYRDLHDDVGAKLLSLVYRAESPDNATLARAALQDLRDVVSTTHPENLTLEAICADWRAECEQRLREAGIAIHWTQPDQFGNAQLTQPQALNLGRILREAVSNIIKHAQAGQAWLTIRPEADGLDLKIRDDGIGCPDAPARPGGRGLHNMAQRAGRIGAQLDRENLQGGGCQIRIHLPLEPVRAERTPGFPPQSSGQGNGG
jgi:signal transduction histidine kinase